MFVCGVCVCTSMCVCVSGDVCVWCVRVHEYVCVCVWCVRVHEYVCVRVCVCVCVCVLIGADQSRLEWNQSSVSSTNLAV